MHPTILIADDDRGLLAALRIRLQQEGFRVVTTSDGYQALALTHREHPDLLLLDIAMPAGSGFSVHDRLQTSEPGHEIPTIYMTGDHAGAREQQASEHGGFALLRKPFEMYELVATIWSALDAATPDQNGSFQTVQ